MQVTEPAGLLPASAPRRARLRFVGSGIRGLEILAPGPGLPPAPPLGAAARATARLLGEGRRAALGTEASTQCSPELRKPLTAPRWAVDSARRLEAPGTAGPPETLRSLTLGDLAKARTGAGGGLEEEKAPGNVGLDVTTTCLLATAVPARSGPLRPELSLSDSRNVDPMQKTWWAHQHL
ncbi:uncharacterized protein LOC144239570 [Crocuta crocuta]